MEENSNGDFELPIRLEDVLTKWLSPYALGMLIRHNGTSQYTGLNDNDIEINHTGHSDYSGSSYGHINCFTLMRDFPEFLNAYSGGMGTEFLYIDGDQIIETQEQLDRAIAFADVLISLDGYPIHDEDKVSEYESELQFEAITEWAKFNAPAALRELFVEADVLAEVAYNAYREYDNGDLIICDNAHFASMDERRFAKAVWTYVQQIVNAALGETE